MDIFDLMDSSIINSMIFLFVVLIIGVITFGLIFLKDWLQQLAGGIK